jgi:hypothetical protein
MLRWIVKNQVTHGIKRGVRWRDYGGLRHPDIVSIEVLPNTGPAVRIFNVYNRNTLRSVNLLDELQHAERWIVAGDMNAHHPRWSRADREPSEDWRHVLPIVNAGTLAIEPGTITRIGSAVQRSSTIDLVISGPGHGIDSLSAIIAEDVRTGSDHEVITWELFADDQGLPNNSIAYDDQTPAWKLRAPIKTEDKDELKEWREKWISGFSPYTEPMTDISRFTKFLDEEFGRKRWSPFAKRWWSDELDKERKRLFGIPRNSVGYKAARAQWFKTVRKAKRECWEELLQLSDTDAVWKTINAKPAGHAMPTLRIPGNDNSVKLASTHQEKAAAISAISFPDRDDDPIPPIPGYRPGVPHFQPVCPKSLNELLSSTRNTSAPGQDGIGYQALRLWSEIDSEGLCYLTNLLTTQGLPKELKTAKVVVIGKPGKKDMSNPKSYRCISLLSNVAKLTEKAVAQYLTLEG